MLKNINLILIITNSINFILLSLQKSINKIAMENILIIILVLCYVFVLPVIFYIAIRKYKKDVIEQHKKDYPELDILSNIYKSNEPIDRRKELVLLIQHHKRSVNIHAIKGNHNFALVHDNMVKKYDKELNTLMIETI